MPTCRIEITAAFDEDVNRSQILADLGQVLDDYGAQVSVSKLVDEVAITAVRRRGEPDDGS